MHECRIVRLSTVARVPILVYTDTMSTYQSDKECPNCKSVERYLKNDRCAPCCRISYKKSRNKHIQKRREADRERFRNNYVYSPRELLDTGPWCVTHTSARRRAKEKGALDVNMSKEENELIRKLYQRCVELNELWGTDFVVDHLQPLAAGGKHEWTNLMLLDGALNYRKMDSWPWSYEIMVRNGAVIERHIRT